jgi:hypothetical protein
MRRMKYTRCQKSAYHEAGHAVAAMRREVPFEFVYIFDCESKAGPTSGHHFGGAVQFPIGIVDALAQSRNETAMLIALSAIAANKELQPWHSYCAHVFAHGLGDIEVAKLIAEKGPHASDAGEYIDKFLMGPARAFVKKEWPSIVAIAEALIASPNHRFSYSDCCNLIGIGDATEAKCA